MSLSIFPKALQKNNKIVIIAPSGRLVEGTIDFGVQTLESWGLQVYLSKYLQKGHHYFSGTDSERLHDLQEAIDNPEVAAIFCARGGYGITRILDKVDFSSLKKQSKWVIGFSDITALHLKLYQLGLCSVHGVMPAGFEKAESKSIESLKSVLFGEPIAYEFNSNQYNKEGKAKGKIIGGNLSLIVESLGTPSEVCFDHTILFIEEIDEYRYKIDRMMMQLKRAGKLSHLAGLIVGHFSGTKDTLVPFGMTTEALILDHVSEYNFPIAFNIPIGHEPLNIAVPYSCECTLDVGEKVAINFKK